MAFDSAAPAGQLVKVLQAVLGTNSVQFGAPLAFGPKMGAYVTLGHQPGGIKTQGTVWRDAHYFIDLAYRISDDTAQVSAAETALMAALDAIQAAIYADKTLAGTCQEATIDTGLAETPEYRLRSGQEFREYPLVVICRQYATYAVNPGS